MSHFVIRLPTHQAVRHVERDIRRLADLDPLSLRPAVSESARDELKFGECLPDELADRVVQVRLADPAGVADTLANRTRVIIADQT